MNMSDDVSSAVVGMSTQVAGKALDVGQQAVDKTIENIAKLLDYLFTKHAEKKLNSSDMSELSPGEVHIKDLISNSRKNNDTVVTQNSLTEKDMKFISAKAEEYGIPVAFTNKANSDSISVHVRGSDKAILKQISTEMIQDKINAHSNELGNIVVDKWQANGIQRELEKHDLCGNWCNIRDENGLLKKDKLMLVYEKSDDKAIKIAYGEFVRKCKEVENNLITDPSEDGSFLFSDRQTEKEFSLQNVNSREDLEQNFREHFGYDENKSEIAAAKFGETLKEDSKKIFFSDIPQNNFVKVVNHIELKDENILAKDYTCLRITPKSDGVPKLVFRDKDNNFVVLNPEKMSRKQLSEKISEELNITDKATINALADKARRVTSHYNLQDKENQNHSFGTENQNVSADIERQNKDKCNVKFTVSDNNGNEFKRETDFSFSNKKTAIENLKKQLEEWGLPPETAEKNAKEIYNKGYEQSAEKVFLIDEIRSEIADKNAVSEIVENPKTPEKSTLLTVSYGVQTENINFSNRKEAIEQIQDKFGVSDLTAGILFEQSVEKIYDKISEDFGEQSISREDFDNWVEENFGAEKEDNTAENAVENTAENTAVLNNGHENHIAETTEKISEKATEITAFKPEIADIEVPDIPTSRGGRK